MITSRGVLERRDYTGGIMPGGAGAIWIISEERDSLYFGTMSPRPMCLKTIERSIFGIVASHHNATS